MYFSHELSTWSLLILYVEITDEELDQYIIEELFPLWEKLGKALQLPGCFLEDTYNDFLTDPAERLRVILREWRAKAECPSIDVLEKRLKQIGYQKLDPTINWILHKHSYR